MNSSPTGHPARPAPSMGLALRDANQALLLAALQAQVASEAADDARRQQTEFLHRLAHELRAPLAPLRHACALLAQPRGAATLQAAREVIDRQVDHLALLVDDLLDAARLRTGRLSLRLATTDLQQVLAAAVQTCQTLMELRAQSLQLHLPAGPALLHGDTARLTQVFSNLLSNASKYTPLGGHITLALALHSNGASIQVSDDGIGISAQALAHVFDAYVQEAHAVRRDDSGLGLGLTLARELVLAHGGRITAHSAGLGQGTCIDVWLPLQPGDVLPLQPGEALPLQPGSALPRAA